MQLVQSPECVSGVSAPRTDARSKWEIFLQMNASPPFSLSGHKGFGGSPHKVISPNAQSGVTAGKFNAFTCFIESDLIAQRHGQKEGFQRMKPIMPAGQHVENEINFAGRLNGEAHHLIIPLIVFVVIAKLTLVFSFVSSLLTDLCSMHEPGNNNANLI